MENFAPGSGTKADSVTKPARILIIAGSDSGGGAGIQADIKTVTMLGGFAMTAVTAITAQNTLGVEAVMPVPAEMVLKQIDAIVGDLGVDVVKIGMIGTADVAEAVDARLDSRDTHGTGCTLASAIATGLGHGCPLAEAIAEARQFVRRAILAAPGFGSGHGPMAHWAGLSPP